MFILVCRGPQKKKEGSCLDITGLNHGAVFFPCLSSLELESKQGVKRCPTLNSDTGTCLSHIQGHLFCSLCLCFSLDLVDLYIMIHFSHTQFSTPLRKFGGSEKIFYKNCYFSVYNLLYKQCNNHKVLSLNKKYKKTKLQLHTKHGF